MFVVGQKVVTPGRGSQVVQIMKIDGAIHYTLALKYVNATGPYAERNRIENTNQFYAFDLVAA